MHKNFLKRAAAALLSAAALNAAVFAGPSIDGDLNGMSYSVQANAEGKTTIADLPSDYQYGADWIWNNRIMNEDSLGIKGKRWNNIFDQIIAGKGTINYVVRWQSYRQVTYEQRQQFEKMLSDSINGWTDWLVDYENWPYQHVDVKVVGWAVIDESCLLDLHDDEIVYTDTTYYDAQYDTSNGDETIPDKLPNAPVELSRFEHFGDKSYEYPGGLDKRFDMYMWATQGFPYIGGCGGDWGQRLSDIAYLNMLDTSGIHVLEHEIGHGFGMTDFYGGEGESDGFPPGGFPGGENSIMMAGSATKITNFDGWMLRYMWSQIMNDTDRFDLANAAPAETTTTTTTAVTTTTTVTETVTTTTTTAEPVSTVHVEFTDTIRENTGSTIWFESAGRFFIPSGDYYGGDEARNLANYEAGDRITISMDYQYDPVSLPGETVGDIVYVDSITLVSNVRDTTTTTTTTEVPVTTTTAEPFVTTTADDNTLPYGDANCDGAVDVADATLIMQCAAAPDDYQLSDKGKKLADVIGGGDGVTPGDALAIQQYLAEIIHVLPVS